VGILVLTALLALLLLAPPPTHTPPSSTVARILGGHEVKCVCSIQVTHELFPAYRCAVSYGIDCVTGTKLQVLVDATGGTEWHDFPLQAPQKLKRKVPSESA
jgi:hypothetical protein